MKLDKCWSANNEDFNAHSLYELLDGNDELKAGDTVYVGDATPILPQQLIKTEDILDTIGERAYDLVGEHADGFPDVSLNAEHELDNFLRQWIEKHCQMNFWQVLNVKPYVITAEDMAQLMAEETGN